MHFIHNSSLSETIAAIATPPGEGGVAIIRISGKEALPIANRLFSTDLVSTPSHTARYGKIFSPEGETIDAGLALVMRSPRSYTGEDTVELHCHGGSLIARRVLESALLAGARAAGPGEFTYRAFLNGKIDLSQAEAVQELISARGEHALSCAQNQLEGALSKKIIHLQERLFDIAAHLEAWVDFPEEGLAFSSKEELLSSLASTLVELKTLHGSFGQGKKISEGISLCLIGRPNVGKSSLLNALLGKERAIVTATAGTTRDLIEEELKIASLPIRLIDTAGIRETEEEIEKEGIRRSKEASHAADLILLLLDATTGETEEDRELFAQLPPEKTLRIWNKIDLISEKTLEALSGAKISAKNEVGLRELRQEIEETIWKGGPPSKEEIVITNLRHHRSLAEAISPLERVIEGIDAGISPEFLSADLRATLRALGTIIGKDISEEILSAIFAKFCVGK